MDGEQGSCPNLLETAMEGRNEVYKEMARRSKTPLQDALADIAFERKLGKLSELYSMAGGEERGLVEKALIDAMGISGRNGYIVEVAEHFLKGPQTGAVAKACVAAMKEGIFVCARTGWAKKILELLGMKGLPADVALEGMRAASGNANVDQMGYARALVGILRDAGAPNKLKKAAYRELMEGGLERCANQKHFTVVEAGSDFNSGKTLSFKQVPTFGMGEVALWARTEGLPLALRLKAIKACSKSEHFTRLGDIFSAGKVRKRIRDAAERGLMEGMGWCGPENRGIMLVALLRKKGLPEKVQARAIELAQGDEKAAAGGFVYVASDIYLNGNSSGWLKEVAAKGLLEGIRACGRTGHVDFAANMLKRDLPEEVRVEAVRVAGSGGCVHEIAEAVLRGNTTPGLLRAIEGVADTDRSGMIAGAIEARRRSSTPPGPRDSGIGFVDTGFKPPSSERRRGISTEQTALHEPAKQIKK